MSRFGNNVSPIYYPTAKIAKSTKIDFSFSQTCSIPCDVELKSRRRLAKAKFLLLF